MPELPEVETIKRGLVATIINQTIDNVEVLLSKMVLGDVSLLERVVVNNVVRRGKLLIIDTYKDNRSKDEQKSILIHLKMTGQLIFESEDKEEFGGGHPIPPLNTPVPNKSTKVIFYFESGDRLYFNDLRTFGYVKIVNTQDVEKEKFLETLGVEPLGEKFTYEYFESLLKKSPKLQLKPFLLDQTKISGLGNIYADESLHHARLLPTRVISSLALEEQIALYESIKIILARGIEFQGASKSSFVDVNGKKGTFTAAAAVYQRTGEPCLICGRPISKIKFAGRGTHFCENCQK